MDVTKYQDPRLVCLCTCFVISTLYVPSCNRDRVEVAFYIHDGYTFSQAEQRTIRSIVEAAAQDARRLLPELPTRLIIRVNPGKQVIDEIGSTSSHSPPNLIYWTVDPSRDGGVIDTAQAHLRATLFHHFHRLTRLKRRPDVTLMDHVVSFGMATAFERDAGGKSYPWGQYSGDMTPWVKELTALPPNADLNHWMQASGKSAAELVTLPTADVVRLYNQR